MVCFLRVVLKPDRCVQDAENPFNGGVKAGYLFRARSRNRSLICAQFTAMPPAKRFRDMHLLSGGEFGT